MTECASGRDRSCGRRQADRVDAVRGLAGPEVGWPGCGEGPPADVEVVDRVQEKRVARRSSLA